MAIKEEDFDFEKFSFDDFDFGDTQGGFSEQPNKSKARKAVDALTGSFISGIKTSIRPNTLGKKLLDEALPKEYTVAYDTAVSAKDAVSSIYDSAKKEVDKGLNDNASAIQKQLDKYSDKLPNRFRTPLRSWTSKLGSSSKPLTEQQRQEVETVASLNKIFGDNENRKFMATQAGEAQISNRLSQHNNELTANLLSSHQRIVAYQDQVDMQWKRKTLELQYKQYFVQKRTLDTVEKTLALQNKAFADIVKNTSLPDAVKMRTTEVATMMLREKMWDSVFGATTRAWGNNAKVTNLFRGAGQNAAKNVQSILSMAIGMGGMLTAYDDDMFDDMFGGEKDDDFTKNTKKAGEWLGEKAGKWGVNKVFGKYGERIKNSQKTKHGSGMINNILLGGGRSMKHMMATGDSGNLLGDLLLSLIGSKDLVAGNNFHVAKSRLADLNEQTYFDVLTKRAITDVIPGYLSKIHREMVVMNTGDQSVTELRYNHSKAKFTGRKELRKDMRSEVFSERGKANLENEFNTMKDILGLDRFDNKTRMAIMREITKTSLTGKSFSLNNIQGLSKEQREAFGKHLEEKFGINQLSEGYDQYNRLPLKEQMKIQASKTTEQLEAENTLYRSMQKISQGLQQPTALLNSYAHRGDVDVMMELGLVDGDARRGYTLNLDRYLDQLMNSGIDYNKRTTFQDMKEKEDMVEKLKKMKYDEMVGFARNGARKLGEKLGIKEAKDKVNKAILTGSFDDLITDVQDKVAYDKMIKVVRDVKQKGAGRGPLKVPDITVADIKEVYEKTKDPEVRKVIHDYVTDTLEKGKSSTSKHFQTFSNQASPYAQTLSNTISPYAQQASAKFTPVAKEFKTLTQQQAEKIFETEFGKQVQEIYSSKEEIIEQAKEKAQNVAQSVETFIKDHDLDDTPEVRKSLVKMFTDKSNQFKDYVSNKNILGKSPKEEVLNKVTGDNSFFKKFKKATEAEEDNSSKENKTQSTSGLVLSTILEIAGLAKSAAVVTGKAGFAGFRLLPWAGKKLLKMAKGASNFFHITDGLYIWGEKEPRMLKTAIIAGNYINGDGKVIETTDDVYGSIFDISTGTPSLVMSQSEYKGGLYDATGTLILQPSSKASRLASKLIGGAVRTGIRAAGLFAKAHIYAFRGIVSVTTWPVRKLIDWIVQPTDDKSVAMRSSVAQASILSNISDKITELFGKKKDANDSDGDGDRDGNSADEIKANAERDMAQKLEKKKQREEENAKRKEERKAKIQAMREKASGLLGGIGDKLGGLFGGMFGGFGKLGGLFGRGAAAAGAAGAAGAGAAGAAGGALAGGLMAKMGGVLAPLLGNPIGLAIAGVLALFGWNWFKDDGKGSGELSDKDSAKLLPETLEDSKLARVAMRTLTMPVKLLWDMKAKATEMMLGAVSKIPRMGVDVANWGARKTTKFLDAIVQKYKNQISGIAGIFGSVPKTFVDRIIGNENTTPLFRMRMAQYGMNYFDRDAVRTVLELEAMMIPYVKNATDSTDATLGKGVKTEDAMRLFNVVENDENRVRDWIYWYTMRYMPVFLTHVTSLNRLGYKATDLHFIDSKLKKPEKQQFIDKSSFIRSKNSPYDVDKSPLSTDKKLDIVGINKVNKHIKDQMNAIDDMPDDDEAAKKLEERAKMAEEQRSQKVKQHTERKELGRKIYGSMAQTERAVSKVKIKRFDDMVAMTNKAIHDDKQYKTNTDYVKARATSAATSKFANKPADMKVTGSGISAAKVVEVSNQYTVVEGVDGSLVKQEGNIAWRNNNPGLIENGALAESYGALPVPKNTPSAMAKYAVFPTYEAGLKAQEALMFEDKEYARLNLNTALTKYSTDGDGSKYKEIVSAVGNTGNKPMHEYTTAERRTIMNAVSSVDGYQAGTAAILRKGSGADAASQVVKSTNVAHGGKASATTIAEALGNQGMMAREQINGVSSATKQDLGKVGKADKLQEASFLGKMTTMLSNIPTSIANVMKAASTASPIGAMAATAQSVGGAIANSHVGQTAVGFVRDMIDSFKPASADSAGPVAKIDTSTRPGKAASIVRKRAGGRSQGLCSRYVREALQQAGYRLNHPPSAYQNHSDGRLSACGFTQIDISTPWQVGDVLVQNRGLGGPHGHIQIWDGTNWISDFIQNRIVQKYPQGALYRDKDYLSGAKPASGWQQISQVSGAGRPGLPKSTTAAPAGTNSVLKATSTPATTPVANAITKAVMGASMIGGGKPAGTNTVLANGDGMTTKAESPDVGKVTTGLKSGLAKVPGIAGAMSKAIGQAGGSIGGSVPWRLQGDKIVMGNWSRTVKGPQLPGLDRYGPMISAKAKAAGIEPAVMLAMCNIESGFKPNAANTNYGGLFAIDKRKHPNWANPEYNTDEAIKLFIQNKKTWERRFPGDKFTAGKAYLLHQQGPGGGPALYANKDRNVSAAEALKSGGWGGKSIDWIKRHVIQSNGGNPNMTAGEFAYFWINKADALASYYSGMTSGAVGAGFGGVQMGADGAVAADTANAALAALGQTPLGMVGRVATTVAKKYVGKSFHGKVNQAQTGDGVTPSQPNESPKGGGKLTAVNPNLVKVKDETSLSSDKPTTSLPEEIKKTASQSIDQQVQSKKTEITTEKMQQAAINKKNDDIAYSNELLQKQLKVQESMLTELKDIKKALTTNNNISQRAIERLSATNPSNLEKGVIPAKDGQNSNQRVTTNSGKPNSNLPRPWTPQTPTGKEPMSMSKITGSSG